MTQSTNRRPINSDLSMVPILQESWEDDALVKIWSAVSQAYPDECPPMDNAARIKARLKNPANEVTKVTQLVLRKGLDIKAIPPQLQQFPNLTLLIVENDIDVIPDWVEEKENLKAFIGDNFATRVAIAGYLTIPGLIPNAKYFV